MDAVHEEWCDLVDFMLDRMQEIQKSSQPGSLEDLVEAARRRKQQLQERYQDPRVKRRAIDKDGIHQAAVEIPKNEIAFEIDRQASFPFQQLPERVTNRIFSLLHTQWNVLAKVCRLWNTTIRQLRKRAKEVMIQWNPLRLLPCDLKNILTNFGEPDSLNIVLSKPTQLHEVHCAQFASIAYFTVAVPTMSTSFNSIIAAMLTHMKNLEAFTCKVYPGAAVLQALFDLPKFKSLAYYLQPADDGPEVLEITSKLAPRLASLCMEASAYYSEDTMRFAVIAQYCTNLRTLRLKNLEEQTEIITTYVSSSYLQEFFVWASEELSGVQLINFFERFNKTLKKVSILSLSMSKDDEIVGSFESNANLWKLLGNLEDLTVSWENFDTLVEATKFWSNLRTLTLHFCYLELEDLDKLSILKVFSNCPQLNELHIMIANDMEASYKRTELNEPTVRSINVLEEFSERFYKSSL